MIERYLQFGMDYPDYYDVMFTNRIVPKYRECLGTRLEAVAARDRETALKSLSLVELALMDLHSSDPDYNKEDARYGAIRLWCDINGVITLKNSRLLHEVEEDVERLVRRLAEDIFARHRE
jgi:hypothetical protein